MAGRRCSVVVEGRPGWMMWMRLGDDEGLALAPTRKDLPLTGRTGEGIVLGGRGGGCLVAP